MSIFTLDDLLFRLINGSGITLFFIFGVLKILAKETKWSGDDKIIEMLLGLFQPKKPLK